MTILQLEQVTKCYQSGSPLHPRTIRAVDGVSLCAEAGECLAIVGESGSGKSTLLRLAAGLEPPSEGRLLFSGKPYPKRMRGRLRRAIQLVYQNSFDAANPRFTARQVIEEPIRYFHLTPRAERRDAVARLLQTVGLPASEMDKKVTAFSGGQLQRICIARALAAQPEVVLLDEPLSSLDVSVQAQILNLLKDLQEEYRLTYLLISHDLEMVYNLADHLAVMYFGRIVEEITDMSRFSELRHPYTRLLLNDAALADRDLEAEGCGQTDGGCIYAQRCPFAEELCRRQAPPLTERAPGHRIACHRESANEKA